MRYAVIHFIGALIMAAPKGMVSFVGNVISFCIKSSSLISDK
jgi:hypothetical protein